MLDALHKKISNIHMIFLYAVEDVELILTREIMNVMKMMWVDIELAEI